MTRKQGLLLGGKVVFSVLLLWLVLSKVDIAGIVARLRGVDVRWLIPALGIGPVVVGLSAWRWRELSMGLLSFGEALRYTWIGIFFGSIVPGLVGGDVAKGLSLAAANSRARDSRLPLSIVVDKLVGFWMLLLLFSLVAFGLLVTQPQLLAGGRRAVWVASTVTLGGLFGGVLLCCPRGAAFFSAFVSRLPFASIRALAGKITAALNRYDGRGRVLWRAAAISALLHVINALSFWLVMRALAIPASPWFAAVFYPMLSALLALPLSISGVGVRDVFAAGMFTAFGLNSEVGVAFSWLLLALSLPNALVGGLLQCWEVFHRRPAH